MLVSAILSVNHNFFKGSSPIYQLRICIKWLYNIDHHNAIIAPSLRLGATAQGLQVINSVDPCVLKSNYYVYSVIKVCSCLRIILCTDLYV